MTLLLPYRRPLLGLPFCRNGLWLRARAVPSLDVPFADNKSLVDAITGRQLISFARASSGTYTDSAGVLQTAATDVPRFDHRITSTTTNLATRSEEFDNATWVQTGLNAFGSGSVANAIAAPDGTVTGDLIEEDTSTGFHRVSQTLISGTISTGTYTASVYVKANQRSRAYISLDDNATGGVTAGFVLLTQAFNITTAGSWSGSTASIEDVGNGWFRISLTSTKGDGSSALTLHVGIAQINVNTISYTGNGTAGLYVWGAQLVRSDSKGQYVRTGAAAASFSTTESLGLLVEEQRTNSIRNNTMVGAVAGTPGTVPTNWGDAPTSNGLNRQIVGVGTQNGITYIDIRYSGTTTATASLPLQPELGAVTVAATGQSWTASSWLALAGGSTSGLTVIQRVTGRSSVGGFLENTDTSVALSSTLTRYAASITMANASTLRVSSDIVLSYSSGATIDITLRIGLPQLEQGATASSVIPNPSTTAAATRNADVVSITGTNFSSWYRQDEGTVFVDSRREDSVTTQHRPAAYAGNSGNTNRIEIRNFSIGANTRAYVNDGGSPQANFDNLATIPASTSVKVAIATKLNDFAAAVNGLSPQADTSGTAPVVDRLEIGTSVSQANCLNGTIKRLTYWPQRLDNATIQAITQ